ncbi:GNAT family N-acetyltransferase [Sediminibacillus albus]|uniref:N-acetylglutamate synthase, GNAT family n=1 Tax=Sediminibacillus albus TaxID=407036 RepID=A0A1G9AUN4_9BACI|nr:GNAT family N-acetyltransferase [Sediminibacillus albus]SDK30624.1 N-acetylglutamate synthase, GNAT family [Sediminibacillus albus]
MIRLAEKADLNRIMEIVKASVKVMNEQGNFQWSEDYPLESHYLSDMENGELYVIIQSGLIAGTAAISEKEHDEYPLINWRSSQKALTIKRVAIDPICRGKGMASALYQYAEKVAREKKLNYLKTDTFAKNMAAQKLFRANGYHYVQARPVQEKADSLYYYDKLLASSN